MEKGYTQIYTGNGKGKTTASIGLIVRAVGAGKKVYFGQFLKNDEYSEIKILKTRFPEVTVEQYRKKDNFIIKGNLEEEDILDAKKGFGKAKTALLSGKYSLVIIDEINVAVYFDLISVEKVIELINLKPDNVELVLTGRYAGKEIMEKADLISEIIEIKHYYDKGVLARKGIEL